MNSVSEKIDERILRLLGLEDVFDIDYDTYFNLIREAIVLGANKLPQEELAVLANERKRIRGKTGRFRLKKEKITADKIATTKFLKPSKKSISLAPPSSKQDDVGSLSIGKQLESISKTLSAFLKFRKKSKEEDRKDTESQKRGKREEGLEGLKNGMSAVAGAAKKMLAPFQSIIDRIWKFIFFTLLGRAFTQLMDWLGDPANKKKIDVLSRFLKDWWPTLLGAAVLFFTPFGAFVRKTLGLVGSLTGKLVKAIPGIATAVKSLGVFAAGHPLLTIGAITGVSAAAGYLGEKKRMEDIAAKQGTIIPPRGKESGILNMIGEGFRSVGQIGASGITGLAAGGMIPRFSAGGLNSFGTGYDGIDGSTGQKVSGFGADTQMIVAQPGEIVMNKKTVDAVGSDTLLGLNRQYGGPGANKPKMGKLYNTGGIVGMQGGGQPSGGGLLNQLGRFLPGTGTVMAPRSGGPTDRQGVRQTQAGFQNKLLGINLGGASFPRGSRGQYTDQENSRYYQQSGRYFIPTDFGSDRLPGIHGLYTPPGRTPRASSTTSTKPRPTITSQATGLANRLSAQGQQKQDILNQQLGRNDKTMTWGQSHQILGNQLGWSTQAEQIKKAQEQGLLKKQGGGIIPEGPFTPLPSPGYVRPQGSFIPKPILRLPGPMPGTTVPFGYDPFRGLQGGGLIKENTGRNIRGATADRQLAALQPGEYVLPVDTVNRLGTSLIDKLVAMTDGNSNSAKLGQRNINKPKITPLPRSGMGGMMTLPPINQGASGSGVGGSPAGSDIPKFMASSPSGMDERIMNATIYGIV